MCKVKSFLTMLAILPLLAFGIGASADETCMSPYMAKIVGQEDFVYVWRSDYDCFWNWKRN